MEPSKPDGKESLRPAPRSRRAHLVGWWAASLALWLMLTTTLDPQELAAGAVAAGIAALAAELVRAQGIVRFRVRVTWLGRARRLPGRVLADSVLLGRALWRDLAGREPAGGRFWAVPFDPRGDDEFSATRRALVIAAISLTPNTYVLGIDRDRGLLLAHQLVASRRAAATHDIVGRL